MSEALHVPLQILQQFDPAALFLRVQPELVGLLLGGVQPLGAGLVPQLISLYSVLEAFHLLLAGAEGGGAFVRLLSRGGALLIPQSDARRQLGQAEGDFL